MLLQEVPAPVYWSTFLTPVRIVYPTVEPWISNWAPFGGGNCLRVTFRRSAKRSGDRRWGGTCPLQSMPNAIAQIEMGLGT